MAAQLKFRDVTLGYDRHPAVHHLNGEVASGALLAVVGPNGAGKSTLFRGHRRHSEAAGGLDRSRRPRHPRHRLSAAERRYRPHLSDLGVRFRRHRAVARDRLFRRHGQGGARARSRRRSPPSASTALKTARSARCPAARCSACCSRGVLLQDARLIVLDEPFNAIDAKTSADLLALVQALARREAHGAGGAARHGSGARPFPGNAAAGARAGGVGRDRAGADRGKPAWRRGGCARRSTTRAAACAVDDMPSRAA